eukprot:m.203095 g.203095  ORF g.203095 m.203095 type:complete len:422 (+) comp15756_c0_seq5:4126-5391(+)
MAPATAREHNDLSVMHRFKHFVDAVLFDSKHLESVSYALIIVELFICFLIVSVVNYTEIDWKAYMDEVEGAINGTFDYTLLKGDTGPLVYPAGFVYLFGALYYATEHGVNIARAQFIFIGFYILNLILVHRLYIRSNFKFPPIALMYMSFTSYRVHSIFVLRLFNDPIAMIFLYAAIHCVLSRRWYIGCLLFSLGVSIKMNVLLYAPALGLMMVISLGVWGTLPRLFVCFIVQVILGLPFLMDNMGGYLGRAFELSRQFKYVWTVNWKCLPENIFLDRRFHAVLLITHLSILLLFTFMKWTRSRGGLFSILQKAFASKKDGSLTHHEIIMIMFSCNFVGVMFARSLHYQFYSWYYHTLPYIIWTAKLSTVSRVALLLAVEYSWNTFPATWNSSFLLHMSHFVILLSMWSAPLHTETKKKKT